MKKKATHKKPKKSTPEEPRQTAIFDQSLVARLAYHQCSDQDIADICSITLEKLESAFAPVLSRQRALGRAALRESMFSLATSGIGASGPVSVWLSKQYLDMKDPEKVEPDDSKLEGVEVVDYAKVKTG